MRRLPLSTTYTFPDESILTCSGFDNSPSPFHLVPIEVTKLPSVSRTRILGLRALLTIYIISCLLSISKCSNKSVNCPGLFLQTPLFYKCFIFKKFLDPWILQFIYINVTFGVDANSMRIIKFLPFSLLSSPTEPHSNNSY